MESLYPPLPSSLSGEAAVTEAVWMTRLTVPERSHSRRMVRTASTVASVTFLYCGKPCIVRRQCTTTTPYYRTSTEVYL
jgi:hypothetical protein